MTQASEKSLEMSGANDTSRFSSGLLGFQKRVVPKGDDVSSGSRVRIIHGARDLAVPVAGMTVGLVRKDLELVINFGHNAQALIRGDRVADDYVLASGETLEFLFPHGLKGVGNVWTREEFCLVFRLSSEQYQEWKNRGLPIHNFADGEERITETDFDLWSNSSINGVSTGPPSLQPANRRSTSNRPSSDKGTESPPRSPDQYRRMTDEVASVIHALLAMPGRYDEINETLRGICHQQTEMIAMVKEVQGVVLSQKPIKEWYSVVEVADTLGKKPYTVREWLRLGRITGKKQACGRGKSKDWMISHEELTRYQNEGLLDLR